MEGSITEDMIKKMFESFKPDAETKRLVDSAIKNKLKNIALNHDVLKDNNPYFSHEIKTAKITNQQGSGRCWMFAGLNVLRPAVVSKIHWDEFEFSETYMFFWDKLEKANMFLERVIDRRNLDERDERYQRLLKQTVEDGGWWEYFSYLVKKYGVVPKSAMPDTEATSSSGEMNRQLIDRVHECAAEIHKLASEGRDVPALREVKEACLGDVYRILVFHLGEPPKEFSFRYKSKKEEEEKMADVVKLYDSLTKEAGKEDFTQTDAFKELAKEKVSLVKKYTPRAFAEEFVIPDLDEYINLGNIPARPVDVNYVIDNSRAMVEGPNIQFLNVAITDLKLATLQSVLSDDPVWFAADVARQVDAETGIMHPQLYRFNDIYGIDKALAKGNRLLYGDVEPNHAMVFMGVDYVDDRVVKWLVENSWGEKPGRTGLFHMYDGWFDEYVFMCIVKKKYLPKRLTDMLDKKPVVLKEQDPLGSLFFEWR
jgi:bleomycin hydrolase